MIHRATPFFYLCPKALLSSHVGVLSIDIEWWSENVYEYKDDDWGGYKDIVSKPLDTVENGIGDCDDYAAVAASWEYGHGNDVRLLFLYTNEMPPHPEHIVAAASGRIYDSGHIWENTTPAEFLEQTRYDGFINRNI